jgi:hypothetical protein
VTPASATTVRPFTAPRVSPNLEPILDADVPAPPVCSALMVLRVYPTSLWRYRLEMYPAKAARDACSQGLSEQANFAISPANVETTVGYRRVLLQAIVPKLTCRSAFAGFI